MRRVFNGLGRDLRDAIRAFSAAPIFSATVVCTIALAIAANATVFAWLDGFVRHPFPAIPDGGSLVALNVGDSRGRVDGMPPVAYPTLREWLARTDLFATAAAHAQARVHIRSGPEEQGEAAWVEVVAAEFFPTLGVSASVGRVLSTNDERQQLPVVVLSDSFWNNRLGGAPAVGRTLLVNGVRFTVIGIAPPRFGGVVSGLAFDAWIPLWTQPAILPGSDWSRDRHVRRLQAVARLRDGVDLAHARDELNAVAVAVSASAGESPVTGAGVRWVSDTQLGSLMGPLGTALLAVSAMLLLAAGASVIGLMLARAARRQRETALRAALGVSRLRFVRGALVEAIVLCAMGLMLGLMLAGLGKNTLIYMAPRVALPVHLEPDLNWRVVGYATALSLITAGALSVVPAWRAFRSDLTTMLNLTSRTSTYRRSRMLQAAVVVQVALSVVALATAGLFLRSAASAAAVPAGFGDPNAMLLVTTDLSFSRLPAAGVLALGEDVLRRARLVPGAARAALASAIPLSFGPPPGVQARIDGYVPGPDEAMSVPRVAVSDDYFEAMEIPLVAGRHFDTNDRADLDRVAIVNEAFAQRYWRGQNPIGRRLDQGDGWTVVVGVARDTRWESLTEPVRPLVFRPWTQLPPQTMTLHLRSPAANPLTLVAPLRRELFAAHADLPALEPRSLAQHMRAAFFVQTVGASALTVFGALAGLIAAVGLYGVLAQELAERRREVAVLIALGASPARAAVRYATPVLSLVATGSAVGLGLAVLTGVLVRRQLIGVSPADLPSLLGSAAVLVSVALAACGFPVWRAASANPARALATG